MRRGYRTFPDLSCWIAARCAGVFLNVEGSETCTRYDISFVSFDRFCSGSKFRFRNLLPMPKDSFVHGHIESQCSNLAGRVRFLKGKIGLKDIRTASSAQRM